MDWRTREIYVRLTKYVLVLFRRHLCSEGGPQQDWFGGRKLMDTNKGRRYSDCNSGHGVMYGLLRQGAVALYLQLIAAYKVDYSGSISSEVDGLVPDLSIPQDVFKEFLASGAVRTWISGIWKLRLMISLSSTATAGLCFCKIPGPKIWQRPTPRGFSRTPRSGTML